MMKIPRFVLRISLISKISVNNLHDSMSHLAVVVCLMALSSCF